MMVWVASPHVIPLTAMLGFMREVTNVSEHRPNALRMRIARLFGGDAVPTRRIFLTLASSAGAACSPRVSRHGRSPGEKAGWALSRIRSVTSARARGPQSPPSRRRTAAVPASASFSPTTSM